MAYVPAYPTRINWENEPSDATALNDVNLNKMDYAIYQHDQALQAFDGRISTLEGASYVNSFKGRTGAVTPAQDDYTIDQIKATGTAGQYVALDSNGKLTMVTLPAYPTAGHVVVNSSGTSMTQRSKIKFTGSVSVTDDSTNDQTVVNITGGGGGTGGHTILDPSGSSMTQRTNLQFTGTGVSVSDNAGDDKTVVTINGGGGGGGHTIEDADGTALTQRTIMQFKGTLRPTDDSINQKTVIDDSAVEISWADWQDMTDAQRETYLAEHPKVDVVGFPDADADLQLDFMTKLWENENPSTTFAGQDITLSSDDYDFLLVFYSYFTTVSRIFSRIIPKDTTTSILDLTLHANSTTQMNVSRNFTKNSDTSYTFGSAESQNVANGGTVSTTTNNDFVIPVAIYGFKKKITVTVDAIAEDVSTLASKCMLPDGETSVAEEIGTLTANAIGTKVDLSSYTSQSNMYTCPNDGYLYLYCHTANGAVSCSVRGSNSVSIGTPSARGQYATVVLYVKKGMKLYQVSNSGSSNEISFSPLV